MSKNCVFVIINNKVDSVCDELMIAIVGTLGWSILSALLASFELLLCSSCLESVSASVAEC